jgi:hypothetical protein
MRHLGLTDTQTAAMWAHLDGLEAPAALAARVNAALHTHDPSLSAGRIRITA